MDDSRRARDVVERLRDAMNAHDLEEVVACFHEEVVSVQPAHPSRSFEGRAQLRVNSPLARRDASDPKESLGGALARGSGVLTNDGA